MSYILLVEDNELNSDMLSRRLIRCGFNVDIAADAYQCMEHLKVKLPDLILMDIRLPDRDGIQITQDLKANERTKSIPVIALTAHAMSGDREIFLTAGFDEYDTKPIDLKRLLVKINKLLGT